jgi:hypothetical protein
MHTAIVSIHYFTPSPLLLAEIGYHKKAVYVALVLGLVHIVVTFFSPLLFPSVTEIARGAWIIIAVASVIGFVGEKAEEEKRLRGTIVVFFF